MMGSGGNQKDYGGFVRLALIVVMALSPWTMYQFLFTSHGHEFMFQGSDATFTFILIVGATGLCLSLCYIVNRDDRWTQMATLAAILLKVTAAAGYMWVTFELYGGSADIPHYVTYAQSLKATYETTGSFPILQPFYNTNFVIMVAAAMFVYLKATISAAMVIFALVAYWGQYFTYRAFCIMYPDGNRKLAAVLCLLTPSLVFWTSAIGKDALISPGVGLFCYGYARLIRRPGPNTWLMLAFAIAILLMVRPHIAALLILSSGLAYLVGRNLVGSKGVVAKALGIPLLILASLYVVTIASQFTDANDFRSARTAVEDAGTANQVGGSAINESLATRIAYAPFLMFRPFPWEARSSQAIAASAEGMLFLWLFVRRRRQIMLLLRTCRSDSFRLFILLFTIESCFAMAAAMTNFGLIARQRAMVLGPMLLFLAMPAVRERAARMASLATLMPNRAVARSL